MRWSFVVVRQHHVILALPLVGGLQRPLFRLAHSFIHVLFNSQVPYTSVVSVYWLQNCIKISIEEEWNAIPVQGRSIDDPMQRRLVVSACKLLEGIPEVHNLETEFSDHQGV